MEARQDVIVPQPDPDVALRLPNEKGMELEKVGTGAQPPCPVAPVEEEDAREKLCSRGYALVGTQATTQVLEAPSSSTAFDGGSCSTCSCPGQGQELWELG